MEYGGEYCKGMACYVQGLLKVERWLLLREALEGDRKGPHHPTPLPPPLL